MQFIDKVISRLEKINSSVCVGLDSRYDRLPSFITKNQKISQAIFLFNKNIISATHHISAAYKSNLAFYAAFGNEGFEGLRLTNHFLKSNYGDIPLIADCKRSEMDESAKMTQKEIFDWLEFDCLMATPWFGEDTIKPYLDDPSHGVIIYVHNSNKTAGEFQDLKLINGQYLYEYITEKIVKVWNRNGNVFVEAGATYPEQLKRVRQIIGEDMPLLTAGIGTQGAPLSNLKDTFGKNKKRLLVNSSRQIIFSGLNQKDYFSVVKASAESLRDSLRQI